MILIINKSQQFHNYRTIWEYEPDQCQNLFLISFSGFSRLIKTILSINQAASSGIIVYNASESLMISFQKGVFSDPMTVLTSY